MAGWVYGAGSGGGGTPVGEDKDIQFNNNGAFSGSSKLITDGSGSLSASTTISASSFHGDGSNLTGLTASAVNVADGPEFSLQFRRDTPITGEISGSGLLMSDGNGAISASSNISGSNFYLTPGKSIFFDGNTETAKITNNGPNLDINGVNIILNAATVVSASSNISGSGFHGLTIDLSSSQASSGLGQELQLGSGANRRIGAAEMEGDDYLMVSNSDGRLFLSASAGIELVTDTTDGVGSFGSPIIVYTTEEGSTTAAFVDHNGNISASQNISGANVYVAAGNSIFLNGDTETFKITNNGTNLDINGANIILNGEVSASANVSGSEFHGNSTLLTGRSAAGPHVWLSASNPAFGPGQIFGEQWFGSGSNPGSGFTGASIDLSNFGSGIDFSFRSKEGGATIRSDAGDTTIRATAGEVILSASAGIIGQTSVVLNAGLTTNNSNITANNGSISASLNISGANFYVNPGNSLFLDGSTETFKITNNGTNLDINGANIILNGEVSASSNVSGANFYVNPGNSLFLDGSTETFKITNNGTNLDINGANIILNAATVVSASSVLSASAFFGQEILTSASSDQGLYLRAEGPDPTAGRLAGEPQLVVSGSMVGIGTATPSNSPSADTFLDVRGHVRVGKSGTGFIFSNNDDNTFLKFGGSGVPGSDGISLFAGGKRMLVVDENPSTADAVIIGSASLETDFAVLTAMSAPNGDSMSTAPAFYVSGGADSVGVGTSSPLVSTDIHYTGSGNPINLANDTGGGEVVYFGTSSANLTAGGVYYLNPQGGWESVNSANTGSGHDQLLGIALGNNPLQNGVLIKGYFDVHTYYSGSFIKGGPMYVQSSSAGRGVVEGGYLSGAAPTAADSYVRIVGYGTDTANVIYFNPDSTYVEIGS